MPGAPTIHELENPRKTPPETIGAMWRGGQGMQPGMPPDPQFCQNLLPIAGGLGVGTCT